MGARDDGQPLTFDYAEHDHVQHLIETVLFCAEGVSASFDRYKEQYVKGPGLYLAVVSGESVCEYADRMGSNRWPIDICSSVLDDLERFYTAARDVALSRDGAVVLTVDGTVLEQMVRFKDLTAGDDVAEEQRDMEYADWMGSRHMSAFDTSLRRSVVATITVSEETGRVTVFQSGEYDTLERDELGGPWRTES
jgi:hypothetical protein